MANSFPNGQATMRGIPATEKNRPRRRDIDRMNTFNQNRHQEMDGDGNWANQIAMENRFTEASARLPPRQPRRNPRPPPAVRGPKTRAAPEAKPSTTETPPKDEQLYPGNCRGSKPTKKTLGQNLECSGFIPLVRQVYDRMAVEDQRLPRSLPYAIFQHAMTEFLNAYLLHQGKYVLKVPLLQGLMDPLAAISAEEYNIPQPIYDYICGFGPTITPTGDKVFWNLPNAAIPMGPFEANNIHVRSGTLGVADASNHNVYETYVSPYVTSEYIKVSGIYRAHQRTHDWEPLPSMMYPTGCKPNDNLLGYRMIERTHPDAIRKCEECTFEDSDQITGLLCHSAYAMNLSSSIIGTLQKVKYTKADFKPRENSAAFIFKERIGDDDDVAAILWDEPATLKSPFAFSAAAANRANVSTYKRIRTIGTPGSCFLCNGAVPDGWLLTRNANFTCTTPFLLQRGFRDRPSLRSADHEEEEGLGTVTQDVYNWLDTVMITK